MTTGGLLFGGLLGLFGPLAPVHCISCEHGAAKRIQGGPTLIHVGVLAADGVDVGNVESPQRPSIVLELLQVARELDVRAQLLLFLVVVRDASERMEVAVAAVEAEAGIGARGARRGELELGEQSCSTTSAVADDRPHEGAHHQGRCAVEGSLPACRVHSRC